VERVTTNSRYESIAKNIIVLIVTAWLNTKLYSQINCYRQKKDETGCKIGGQIELG
jgi:hypothetical protein